MKAPKPPNYREETTPAKCCGNCRMFDATAFGHHAGRCWGYGNIPVKENFVCDSWDGEGAHQQFRKPVRSSNGPE